MTSNTGKQANLMGCLLFSSCAFCTGVTIKRTLVIKQNGVVHTIVTIFFRSYLKVVRSFVLGRGEAHTHEEPPWLALGEKLFKNWRL